MSDLKIDHSLLLEVLSYMLCTLAVVCFGVAVWDSVALIMVGEGNVFTVAIQIGAAINLLFFGQLGLAVHRIVNK